MKPQRLIPTFVTFITLTLATASLNAETIFIDFQHDTGVDATGYTIVSSGAGILSGFTDPAPFDLGNGYTLTFTGSYTTYVGDNAANPVDEDGWELTSATGTFTLSGLNAGDIVTMYATNAWDDFGVENSQVAHMSFGGEDAVNVLAGVYTDPGQNDLFGDSQDLSYFTIVASDVVATGPSLSGTIDKTVGPGQFGAFVFDITPATVPEPSTFALLGGAFALGVALVRRRRA